MKTFALITNCSGLKYWSWLGTKHNTSGTHAQMVKKYGDIWINNLGGWFDNRSVKTIHRVVIQDKFPVDKS